MARTVTVDNLIDRIRNRTDTENDQHVTDNNIVDLLNSRYPEYWDLLAEVGPPDYGSNTQTVTVVADTLEYSLPADYYKTRAVWVQENNGIRRPISSIQETDRMSYKPASSAGNVLHEYIKTCPVLTYGNTATETVDGVNGFDELLVLGCSIDIMAKRGQPDMHLRGRYKEIEDRVRAMASRDDFEPERVAVKFNRPIMYQELYSTDIVGYRIRNANIEVYSYATGYYL